MRTINLDLLHLKNGHIALDLGCGTGRHSHAMYHHCNCRAIGIDIAFANVHETHEGFIKNPKTPTTSSRPNFGTSDFGVGVGTALRLPFAASTFDRIICSEVLEHIPDYYRALDEICRIVKTDGRVGISVPRYWPERICWLLSKAYHTAKGGHIRIFRTDELIEDARLRGLRLTARKFAHGLHTPYWWLRCAVGIENQSNWLIRLYHKLLDWEIMKNPPSLRMISKLADRLMGKSVVLYFEKSA